MCLLQGTGAFLQLSTDICHSTMQTQAVEVFKTQFQPLLTLLQVKAGLKKGRKGRPDHLLRLGSARDVNRNHLLACSSAQEGIDRSLISPRPCLENRADGAARALHDSPDSLHAPGEPAAVHSQEDLPVMLQRQLAHEVAAQQPSEATQLGSFQWDRLEPRYVDAASTYETASNVESSEPSPSASVRLVLSPEHLPAWLEFSQRWSSTTAT